MKKIGKYRAQLCIHLLWREHENGRKEVKWFRADTELCVTHNFMIWLNRICFRSSIELTSTTSHFGLKFNVSIFLNFNLIWQVHSRTERRASSDWIFIIILTIFDSWTKWFVVHQVNCARKIQWWTERHSGASVKVSTYIYWNGECTWKSDKKRKFIPM